VDFFPKNPLGHLEALSLHYGEILPQKNIDGDVSL
jgi:hypothetical protein